MKILNKNGKNLTQNNEQHEKYELEITYRKNINKSEYKYSMGKTLHLLLFLRVNKLKLRESLFFLLFFLIPN